MAGQRVLSGERHAQWRSSRGAWPASRTAHGDEVLVIVRREQGVRQLTQVQLEQARDVLWMPGQSKNAQACSSVVSTQAQQRRALRQSSCAGTYVNFVVPEVDRPTGLVDLVLELVDGLLVAADAEQSLDLEVLCGRATSVIQSKTRF